MTEMRIGSRSIKITNPNKVLFPDDGITKAELVDHYRRVAPLMLKHIRDRPVTMERFPDGIREEGFMQQKVSHYFPDWLHHVTVAKEGGSVTHPMCDDEASIVYLANQACITLHTWLSKADRLDYPDQLIFDLDPSGEGDFPVVRKTALQLRDYLAEAGLTSFVKTTGSRGLHVMVGLDRRATFDEVRAFAREVADQLVSRDPGHLTTEARKDQRADKLLIDVMRNSYAQTAVAPYAVRALNGAPVAAPLAWHEIEKGDFSPRKWTIRNLSERLAAAEDPWADASRARHSIKTA